MLSLPSAKHLSFPPAPAEKESDLHHLKIQLIQNLKSSERNPLWSYLRSLGAECSPAADICSLSPARPSFLSEGLPARAPLPELLSWGVSPVHLTPACAHCTREGCQAGSGQNCEALKKDYNFPLVPIPSISFSIFLITESSQQGRSPMHAAQTPTSWTRFLIA